MMKGEYMDKSSFPVLSRTGPRTKDQTWQTSQVLQMREAYLDYLRMNAEQLGLSPEAISYAERTLQEYNFGYSPTT